MVAVAPRGARSRGTAAASGSQPSTSPPGNVLVLDNCEHVVARSRSLTTSCCGPARVCRFSPPAASPWVSREKRSPGAAADRPGSWTTAAVRRLPKYDAVHCSRIGPPGQCPASNHRGQHGDRGPDLPPAGRLTAGDRVRGRTDPRHVPRPGPATAQRPVALLTRGSRAAPTRQQTLRWSIDWSYHCAPPTNNTCGPGCRCSPVPSNSMPQTECGAEPHRARRSISCPPWWTNRS